jgi:hypothetical protein
MMTELLAPNAVFAPPTTLPSMDSVAVVTCVEGGSIEAQTLRMIESLRKWGGRLANLPVVAVTPRFGPAISRATRRRYDELGVRYQKTKAISPYAWYDFINKPAAMIAAERLLNFDSYTWLDADTLIVREPYELLLSNDEQFAACVREKNIGTSGPGDPNHPYWLALCDVLGMKVEDLPWVLDCRDEQRLRLYFNGGVFAYRKGYASVYLDACNKLLDARFQLKNDKVFYHEQAAMGLVMTKLSLRWRAMSDTHNFHFGSRTLHHVNWDRFHNEASILHYHRFMRPENWPKLMELMKEHYPEVQAWLEPMGPLMDNFTLPRWALNKVLRRRRAKRAAAYLKTCRVVC